MSPFKDYKAMLDGIGFLPPGLKLQEYLRIISMIKSEEETLKYADSKGINDVKASAKKKVK